MLIDINVIITFFKYWYLLNKILGWMFKLKKIFIICNILQICLNIHFFIDKMELKENVR